MEKTVKKKAYCKPEMRQVKLVPQEAVLAGCKATTVGPDFSGGCQNAGLCLEQRS